jgi:hypothetical protein
MMAFQLQKHAQPMPYAVIDAARVAKNRKNNE